MDIFVGTNIVQVNDKLIRMEIRELAHRIKQPKEQFKARIEQLRITKSLSDVMYKDLKKTLPYFTCGNFHPAIRRKEYFASIQCFVLDVDHLAKAEINKEELIQNLRQDSRVLLLFTSPGDDGIKVLFHLSEACKDSALFAAFYKVFVKQFANQHGLQSCMDYVTSDVTRACFISYDPNAYFNPQAEKISMEAVIPVQDFERVMQEVKDADVFLKKVSSNPALEKQAIDQDVLAKIRQKLNPKARVSDTRNFIQPQELEALMPMIETKIAELDVQIAQNLPIQYGRKLIFKAGLHWCEINVFYGKKGFSLVKTPKSGSNMQLADLIHQALSEIIYFKP